MFFYDSSSFTKCTYPDDDACPLWWVRCTMPACVIGIGSRHWGSRCCPYWPGPRGAATHREIDCWFFQADRSCVSGRVCRLEKVKRFKKHVSEPFVGVLAGEFSLLLFDDVDDEDVLLSFFDGVMLILAETNCFFGFSTVYFERNFSKSAAISCLAGPNVTCKEIYDL